MTSYQENADTSEQGASRTVTSRWETPGWSDTGSADARKTAGMGCHSPRHLCRVAYTIYVGLSLCSRREVWQNDKVHHHYVNPLVRSLRCGDKLRLVLRVGGIHCGSRQANHPHRWRAAGGNVSLIEDIREVMQSLFATLPRVIILTRAVHHCCYTHLINFQVYRLCAGEWKK